MKLFLNENLINESNILTEDIQAWINQNSSATKDIPQEKLLLLAKLDPTYYTANGNKQVVAKVSTDKKLMEKQVQIDAAVTTPANPTDRTGDYFNWIIKQYKNNPDKFDNDDKNEYKKYFLNILTAFSLIAKKGEGATGKFILANNFSQNIDNYNSIEDVEESISKLTDAYAEQFKLPAYDILMSNKGTSRGLPVDKLELVKTSDKLAKLFDSVQDAQAASSGIESDVVGQTSDFKIYSPTSYQHEVKIAHLIDKRGDEMYIDSNGDNVINNDWCTVSHDFSYNDYLNRNKGSRYYIFVNRHNMKEKYQLHTPTRQFMDTYNHNLIPEHSSYFRGAQSKAPENHYEDDVDFWVHNKDVFNIMKNICTPVEKEYFDQIEDNLIDSQEIEDFKNGSGEYIYDEEHKHINNRLFKYIKKLIIKTNLTEVLTFGSDSSLIEVEFDDALGMNFNWNNIKFQGSNIKTVKLSSNFQELPDYTFKGCSQLETVVVSGNIGSIGNHCFDNCKMLKNCDGLLNSCTYIGDYAFYNTSIDGKINLSNCTSLGEGAFAQTQITDVFAPKINDVKGHVFSFCKQLEKFNFSNITHIGRLAFAVTKIAGNLKLLNVKIEDDAFNGTLIEKVIINSNVPQQCFYNCAKLSRVKILDGCTSIGQDAFSLTSLETLTLPGTMKRIKANSLGKMYYLKKVILSDGIEVLEEFCFKDCSNLEKVLIPNSIQRIDDLAFSGCDKVVVYTDSSYAIDFCKEHRIKYLNMNESLDTDSEQFILNEDYDILDEELTSINSFSEIDDAIQQDTNVKYILMTRIGDLPDKYKYLAPYYENITLYDVLKKYYNNNALIYLDKVGDFYIGCAVAKVNQYSNGISELDFFSFLESDNNIQLLFDLKRLLDELLSNYRYVKFLGNPQSQVNSLYKIIAKKYPCVINEIDSNATSYTLFANEDDLQDSQD